MHGRIENKLSLGQSSVLVTPFAEHLEIRCPGVVGDIVKCSNTDRVVRWNGHDPSLRAFVAFRWIPP